MRFISAAVALLVSSSSAKDTTLINQLTSLKSIVRQTEEWDTNNMINAISARKEELAMDLKQDLKSKKEVADELKYLLELVRDIEANDKAQAVQTLSSRKIQLVSLADDPVYDTWVDNEDGTTQTMTAEPVVEDDVTTTVYETQNIENPDEGDKVKKTVVDTTVDEVTTTTSTTVTTDKDGAVTTVETDKDGVETTTCKADKDGEDIDCPEKTPKTDVDDKEKKTEDPEEGEEEEESKGSMKGPIIGVVAVGIIAGGYCAYKKRSEADHEGGKKEDKKLFKKVFKGKTQKKAAKEEMVPTFAVQSEEQV